MAHICDGWAGNCRWPLAAASVEALTHEVPIFRVSTRTQGPADGDERSNGWHEVLWPVLQQFALDLPLPQLAGHHCSAEQAFLLVAYRWGCCPQTEISGTTSVTSAHPHHPDHTHHRCFVPLRWLNVPGEIHTAWHAVCGPPTLSWSNTRYQSITWGRTFTFYTLLHNRVPSMSQLWYVPSTSLFARQMASL